MTYPSRRGRLGSVVLLLAAAVAAAFSPVPGNGFVNLDDEAYVLKNPHVTPGLTWWGASWAMAGIRNANWHPVTWLSHMLDVSLFGLRPWGHHLSSLLLHMAATIMLFLLLEGMTGAIVPAAAAALLFGVHPLRVESVAWVAERKDVLSASLGMAAAFAYLGYVRAPSLRRYLATVVLFALGLGAKPTVATLPLLFLVMDWWPLGRMKMGTGTADAEPVPILLLEKIPLLALSAVSGMITYMAQVKGEALASTAQYPVGLRLENALASTAGYLWKALVPRDLYLPYPYPDSFPLRALLTAAAVLAGLTWLAVRQRRARPFLLAGWAWYLVALAPVMGLVQSGAQSSADRYTYLPLTGVFIAAAWLAVPSCRPAGRKAACTAAAAVVVALALLTARQVLFWRDSRALFTHALQVEPRNPLAHYYLGNHFSSAGDEAAAAAHYRRAVELAPGFIPARVNLGASLAGLGRHREAEEEFREVLRREPDNLVAMQDLAVALARQGGLRGALSMYLDLLSRRPADPEYYFNLAMICLDTGDLASARRVYEVLRTLDQATALRLESYLH